MRRARRAQENPIVLSETREIALLRILIATGERALEAFQASDNPVDADFVADLERILDRSRAELAAFAARAADSRPR